MTFAKTPVPAWLRLSDFAAALGLANLYLLSIWDELQDPTQGYYCDLPAQTWHIFARAVACLLLFACCVWPLIGLTRQMRAPVPRKLACALLFGILVMGLDVIRVRVLHIYGSSITGLIGKIGFVLLSCTVAGALLYLLVLRDRTLFRGVRGLLLFLAFVLPINLASTARAIHNAWPRERYSGKQASRLIPSPSTPRFIWVIFDEWDDYISFQKRPAGLLLPEIDRFRDQALHADSVVSPASDTLEALPSLTIGRIVQRSRTTTPDELLLTLADTRSVEPWSTQPNVFTRARQLGVNGAVAGFYHPYPRVLGSGLVESFSSGRISLGEDGTGELQKLLFMAQYALNNVPLIANSGLLRNVRPARIHYQSIRQHALKIATQPDLGLVLLHYPVPHLPSIYEPNPLSGSHNPYIDNLALTDRTLKELRNALEAAGQWDGSFVLLSTDHPLRTDGRKNFSGEWARHHPWVPFLLKTPGQKTPLAYSKSFNNVLSQELILAALRGEIRTAEDAAAWLDQNGSRYPVIPTRASPGGVVE